MKRKAVTIHVNNLRLSQELLGVLTALVDGFDRPTIGTNKDGVVVYVDSWSRSAR